MTPDQLAVERDRLLEGGRTLEEVARMQRWAESSEFERLLVHWVERGPAHPRDHACCKCMAGFNDTPMMRLDWLCLFHRAQTLREALR